MHGLKGCVAAALVIFSSAVSTISTISTVGAVELIINGGFEANAGVGTASFSN